MDENLVGYLLDALDPEDRRKMESYLRAHPEARKRLGRLRQVLQPLEADLQSCEPPPDLWVRTLAYVAEYQCRQLPPAPTTRLPPAPLSGRSWWRRADVLVAASLLLCVGALIPSGLNKFREKQNILACKDNLRIFHVALTDYSERHHGEFPNIATAAPPPRNVAGLVVPLLHEEGLLGDDVSVTCPTNGRRLPLPYSPRQLAEMDDKEFAQWAPRLSGCYAYSLGYLDENGQVRGVCLEPGMGCTARLPLMADRPPNDIAQGGTGNSPNHGGTGQNVLYADGHCDFFTKRTVGLTDADDIYVNFDRQVAPGKNCMDAVLGSSATHP
jgi:prepilin-type processing-associated H-X9-DG protein